MDGCLINRNVKCSTTVFSELPLIMFSVFNETLPKGIKSIIIRVVRVNTNINLTIVSVENAVEVLIL